MLGRTEREKRQRRGGGSGTPLPHYSHSQKYLWSAIFVLEIIIWDLRAAAAAAIFRGNHWWAARAPLLWAAAAATVSCLSPSDQVGK